MYGGRGDLALLYDSELIKLGQSTQCYAPCFSPPCLTSVSISRAWRNRLEYQPIVLINQSKSVVDRRLGIRFHSSIRSRRRVDVSPRGGTYSERYRRHHSSSVLRRFTRTSRCLTFDLLSECAVTEMTSVDIRDRHRLLIVMSRVVSVSRMSLILIWVEFTIKTELETSNHQLLSFGEFLIDSLPALN